MEKTQNSWHGNRLSVTHTESIVWVLFELLCYWKYWKHPAYESLLIDISIASSNTSKIPSKLLGFYKLCNIDINCEFFGSICALKIDWSSAWPSNPRNRPSSILVPVIWCQLRTSNVRVWFGMVAGRRW